MHIDLETAGLPSSFFADVCVVGGGVAGILLASRLGRSGKTVHLLEAGGLTFEDRSQNLYETAMLGYPHVGASAGRFRVFGGSSTRWGGQLLPFTEDVIDPDTCLGLPRWPIALSDLEPYYLAAQQAMGAAGGPFSDALLSSFGCTPPFQSPLVRLRFSKCAPFRRRNLAATLGRECIASKRVTVITHANAVAIQLHSGARSVGSVRVVDYAGGSSTFKAKHYVLSTGTIEASRLLLDSTGVAPHGVGNDHDQVGRYFHDHVGVRAAFIAEQDRKTIIRNFASFVRGGTLHRARLEATAEFRREEKLLSVGCQFVVQEPPGSGADYMRALLRSTQRGHLPAQSKAGTLSTLPAALREVAALFLAARFRHRRYISSRADIALQLDVEQRPDAESRVCLGDSVNLLGMRPALLRWKISEDEHRSVRIFAGELKKLFAHHQLANLAWKPELDQTGDAWLSGPRIDTFHMMGGTRMGTDPARSVVDGSLKVHGLTNLYVASCSVFPTGGSSNPTFTMMALSLRLADHLASAAL